MAAIIRVKRCLDEDPLDTFILKCKKRKVDLDSTTDDSAIEDISTAVLKFAGTIKEDENILAHLKDKKLPDPEELKTNFKRHTVNLTDKLRLEHQEASKNSRYKIVNFFRSPSLDTSNKDKEVTILDVETDINQNDANTANKNSEADSRYVYDLYYTNSDFGEAQLEDYVSIYPLNDPLITGSTRDNGINDSDSEDSEDSNAECNWRNDYPDEDDMESINEDDMVKAMKNVELEDLSSDSEEEKFVYSVDSDGEYQDALDDNDVSKFGKKYAAFKAKHKGVETTSFKNDLYFGDIDEDEYYY
ncbi:unnamed protein product [Psylliodes chrysocephalus]|uniref:Probable RNA polymerase II nuclear localization protein SLC7A6OS n=1 Tax=Psylliodes chrysocephalus TaxID=3402493 RepID=A0A9P0CEC7_9CUCU|nr:unnamed protein product [Psylliodes chrysocephala]